MTLVSLNPGKKRRRRRKGKSRSTKRSRAARKAWRTRRARGHVHSRRGRKGRGRRRGRRAARRGACRGGTRRAVRAERKRGNARARKILKALAMCKGKPSRSTSFAVPSWRATSDNPRRRRRARNGRSRFSYRHRRRARNYSTWIPAFRNGLTGSLTQGLNLNTVSSTIPVISGFIGNQYLSSFLSGLGFMPGFMKSGIGNYVLGGLSAGILAAGTGAIKPSMASPVLLGGVSEVMVRVMKRGINMVFGKTSFLQGMSDYFHVGAPIAASPYYGSGGRYMSDDLNGMGDYFNTASPIHQLSGMGDAYGMSTDGDELAGMGDFLDVQNVQHLPTIDALGNPIPPMAMMPEHVAGKELAHSA